MLSKPESMDLMSSINTVHVDIDKVTHFVLHVIYNSPKREMSPRDMEKAKKESLHLQNHCSQIKSP